MPTFPGQRSSRYRSGGTDPEAVRRMLDEAFRKSADEQAGRQRPPIEVEDRADILPDDLTADPEATRKAMTEYGKVRTF